MALAELLPVDTMRDAEKWLLEASDSHFRDSREDPIRLSHRQLDSAGDRCEEVYTCIELDVELRFNKYTIEG